MTPALPPRVELRPFVESDAAWDDIAARYGTAFHQSAWLRLLETTQSGRLLRFGIHESGRLVGIVPLFVRRFLLLRVGASPMVVEDTPYLGLACRPDLMAPGLGALYEYAKTNGIHFLRIVQRERLVLDRVDEGTHVIDKHTHVVDLRQTEDEIWKGMEGKSRTAIRKAEKNGVTVEQETGSDWIEAYYEILSALYQAQEMVVPNPLAFYQGLWRDFHDRGLFVLTARHESRIVAGGIFLVDGDRAYYLNGCSLAQYNHLEPNRAVQWKAMRIAKSMGALRYDFVGSDIQRLALFKRSFGGALTTYTLIERSSAAWVTVSRRAFPTLKQVANRVRSRLRRSTADA